MHFLFNTPFNDIPLVKLPATIVKYYPQLKRNDLMVGRNTRFIVPAKAARLFLGLPASRGILHIEPAL